MSSEDRENVGWLLRGIAWVGTFAVGLVCLGMWGCPQYNVYRQGKEGEAKLREAESSRQIAIQEAKAKSEAAEMLADAEVKRAMGIAKANQIVGESLKNNHEYLTYLWIDKLDHGENTIVYIPTEAGLPILEAGRLPNKKKPEPKDDPKKEADKK